VEAPDPLFTSADAAFEGRGGETSLLGDVSWGPDHLVKGSENLTLETICKIQKVLRIRLVEIADSNTELEIMPEPTEEEVTA
jgi:hypothetical protein